MYILTLTGTFTRFWCSVTLPEEALPHILLLCHEPFDTAVNAVTVRDSHASLLSFAHIPFPRPPPAHSKFLTTHSHSSHLHHDIKFAAWKHIQSTLQTFRQSHLNRPIPIATLLSLRLCLISDCPSVQLPSVLLSARTVCGEDVFSMAERRLPLL